MKKKNAIYSQMNGKENVPGRDRPDRGHFSGRPLLDVATGGIFSGLDPATCRAGVSGPFARDCPRLRGLRHRAQLEQSAGCRSLCACRTAVSCGDHSTGNRVPGNRKRVHRHSLVQIQHHPHHPANRHQHDSGHRRAGHGAFNRD